MPVQAKSTQAAAPARRRSLFKLGTIIVSVVVSMILVESVVRVFRLAPPLPVQYRDFIRDPYLPYVRKPNIIRRGMSASKEYAFQYRHNSQGLRDDEHSMEKPENVFRILALGDSFTWGIGADFEDTYLFRLERLLNRRGPNHKEVEIIKAGVPRFFPEIERLQLEHYGIKYNPDLVLVAFTSNDIVDTVRGLDALRPASREGYLVNKQSARIGSIGTWLYIHVHTARIALRAYLSRTEEPKKKPVRLKDIRKRDRKLAWKKIEEEYDRMHTIADAKGARLVIINIPRAGLDAGPAGRLASILDKKPYAFIDVLPDMRAASNIRTGKLLYWPRDQHCTPAGYAVIANKLFWELTRRELVP